MNGRHRVQRPARQVRLGLVMVPVRLVWRGLRSAWAPVADAWSRLIERLGDRSEDPFADMSFAPQVTSPDPVPAPVEEQEPVQEPLTPGQAFRVLHDRNPHLPASHVRWHFFDGAVAGEVYALDATEDGQREIVQQYAEVLAAELSEHPDGLHLIVAVVGELANVTFTIAAVLIHDDTMPLPVYRESAGTLTTQEISREVLAEAVGAR